MIEIIETRDEAYWTKFYKEGGAPEVPSNFAKFVMERFAKSGQSLIELGCGNGRDARFFAANGVEVTAVDQCVSEIDELAQASTQRSNPHYETADFTDMPDSDNGFDVVYSRFTLHSVSAIGQARALEWGYRNLVPGGLLCVETRGQKNELFRKGEPVEGEPNAFVYEDHYRRFVDFVDFKKEITDTGFNIVEAAERTGFAPHEGTDYHFIRVIARK